MERAKMIAMVASSLLFAACGADAPQDDGGNGMGGAGNVEELDIGVCDPSSQTFTLEIDNPYLPYPVGRQWVYSGEEEGATVDLRITVLDETEEVAGVTTRVIEEHEENDGEVVEISRNFIAQAEDGTVCYFGEEVDIYENGEITSHEGAWRAGGDNEPGILMPADPMEGTAYQQEVAPGVALDRAEIVRIGRMIEVPAGSFQDTVVTEESSPLDAGAQSNKAYARDVGLIVDDVVELESVTDD